MVPKVGKVGKRGQNVWSRENIAWVVVHLGVNKLSHEGSMSSAHGDTNGTRPSLSPRLHGTIMAKKVKNLGRNVWLTANNACIVAPPEERKCLPGNFNVSWTWGQQRFRIPLPFPSCAMAPKAGKPVLNDSF
jgi:hypothetical protein